MLERQHRKARLYLASTSPRRLSLLQQIGLQPQVLSVAVDETPRPNESATDYVLRLACAKAAAAVLPIAIADPDSSDQANAQATTQAWVLAADTTVFAGTEILGKPSSYADAQRIWSLLPSSDHVVLTAVALRRGNQLWHQVVTTKVHFMAIPADEQWFYWQSGEPQDKAGGYAIQGLAALYVRGIEGSYSNVVGLPLAETVDLLRLSQFPLWE